MNYIEGETVRSLFQQEISIQRKEEIIFNYGQTLRNIHNTKCPTELVNGGQGWLEEKLMEDMSKYNQELKKVNIDYLELEIMNDWDRIGSLDYSHSQVIFTT